MSLLQTLDPNIARRRALLTEVDKIEAKNWNLNQYFALGSDFIRPDTKIRWNVDAVLRIHSVHVGVSENDDPIWPHFPSWLKLVAIRLNGQRLERREQGEPDKKASVYPLLGPVIALPGDLITLTWRDDRTEEDPTLLKIHAAIIADEVPGFLTLPFLTPPEEV